MLHIAHHVVMEISHHLRGIYPLLVVTIPPMVVYSHQFVSYTHQIQCTICNMNLVVKFHSSFRSILFVAKNAKISDH